jgi:hypothetical protein
MNDDSGEEKAERGNSSQDTPTSGNGSDGGDRQKSKNYWREIGLILIGAIIAAVPTIVNSRYQAKMELEQFLLDRQITALRDFSTSLNQLGHQSLSKTQVLIFRLRGLEAESQTRQITNEEFSEIRKSSEDLFAYAHDFAASMEMNRTLAYAIFGEKQGGVTEHSIDCADADSEQFKAQITNARTDREKLKLMETQILRSEKSIIRILTDGNAEMRELSKKMRLPL